MTVRKQLLSILAAVLVSAIAGCGTHDPQPNAKPMNPDKAYDQLKEALFGVVQAAVPSQPPVVQDETRAAPCGGAVGTSHSKVTSSIHVANGDPKLTRSADEMATAMADFLKAHGWAVQPIEHNDDKSILVNAGKDGFSIQAGSVVGNKTVTASGSTPCLDNPGGS